MGIALDAVPVVGDVIQDIGGRSTAELCWEAKVLASKLWS